MSNILEIMKTNRLSVADVDNSTMLSSKNNDSTTDKPEEDEVLHTSVGMAFKVLITGKTLTVLLLSPPPSVMAPASPSEVRVHARGCEMGVAGVQFQVSLYNPVFSCQSKEERQGEMSIFDMAINYHRHMAPTGEKIMGVEYAVV